MGEVSGGRSGQRVELSGVTRTGFLFLPDNMLDHCVVDEPDYRS